MEKGKHYFYVVECRDGTLYAGYTNNLEQRIKRHNEGKGAKYTRGRTPVTLRMVEEFDTKGDALRAEHYFKKLKRPEKDRIIAREGEAVYVSTEKFSSNL